MDIGLESDIPMTINLSSCLVFGNVGNLFSLHLGGIPFPVYRRLVACIIYTVAYIGWLSLPNMVSGWGQIHPLEWG